MQSFVQILGDVLSTMSFSRKVRSAVNMEVRNNPGPHVPVKDSKIPYLPS